VIVPRLDSPSTLARVDPEGGAVDYGRIAALLCGLDPTVLVSEPPLSVLGLLALVALRALRCKPLRGPSAFSAKAKP
jgi:hypothetical protein